MINIDSRLLFDLDANEFLLLSYLTSKVNEDRVCWYGNKSICKDLKWSMVRLQATKKRLVDKGLLEVEKRFRENSPAQTSNYYKVITPLTSNYTPTLKLDRGDTSKLDRGDTSKLDRGDTSKLGTAPVSNLGIAPTSKLGNEVLVIEELTTEELTNEELEKDRESRYLSVCVHSIFKNLIECFFPKLEDYKNCMAGYCEIEELEEITDPIIRKSLQKILAAARAIYSTYEKLNKPIPEWRDYSHSWSHDPGEPDATQEATDQIQSYHHWCELTKTWMTSDPDKLPEKIIQTDWCQKLKDYVDDRFPHEYDPIKFYVENEMYPTWIMSYFYEEQMVYVDKRNPNRIF